MCDVCHSDHRDQMLIRARLLNSLFLMAGLVGFYLIFKNENTYFGMHDMFLDT